MLIVRNHHTAFANHPHRPPTVIYSPALTASYLRRLIYPAQPVCALSHIPTYHCSTHVICSAIHTYRSMSGLSYDCHDSSCGSIANFYATLTKASLKSRCRALRCRFDHSPIRPLAFAFYTMASNANAPIVSSELCSLLDNAQRIVDDLWAESGAEIAGAKGYKACRLLSVTNAHPQFPIFATALGSLPSLGNGHSHMCA